MIKIIIVRKIIKIFKHCEYHIIFKQVKEHRYSYEKIPLPSLITQQVGLEDQGKGEVLYIATKNGCEGRFPPNHHHRLLHKF